MAARPGPIGHNAPCLALRPICMTVTAAAAPDFVPVPHLALQQVRLQRGRTTVFDGLSLSLAEPRIGLIGDNGAGKTSLLRLLCGLEVPDTGRVLSQGQDLHAAGSQRARWVGMMFQNPDDQIIFPTVLEELALGLRPQGLSKQQAQAQALAFLQQRGLQDWAERAVTSLSQNARSSTASTSARPAAASCSEAPAALSNGALAWSPTSGMSPMVPPASRR